MNFKCTNCGYGTTENIIDCPACGCGTIDVTNDPDFLKDTDIELNPSIGIRGFIEGCMIKNRFW